MKMIKNNSAVMADTTSDLWEKMNKLTVGECFFQIRNGANIKQGVADGGFPITRIETIANDRFNRDRMGYAGITDADKYQSYILEDGDLLMSHINSVQYLGRTVLYHKQENEKIIHGMNLLAMKANRDILNPAYAQYYFRSIPFRAQIRQITKKSVNQASFTVSDLKKIPIQVPSLLEQCNAVETLDRVNKLLELHQHQLQTLDELVKARFVELFGNPVINNKGWNVSDLEQLTIKIGSGATPKGGKEAYQTDGISLIRSMNVHNGKFEYKELAHISDEQAARLENVAVEENDVLLNITGASVARSCVVPTNVLPARVNQHVCIIRCKDSIMPDFINSLLIDDNYQDLLWSIAGSGATREAITKQQVESLQIILPPISKQEEFSKFINRVDKSKSAVQKSLDEAQLLFDSLMQQYFE